MLRKKKFLIGGLIVVLAVAYLAYTGFETSATYYYTVDEFTAQKASVSGENLRVSGRVADGSVEQDTGSSTMRFVLTDLEGEDSLPVVYHGIVPDTFKANRDVVVEGRLGADGAFQADSILTKCPSKYEPEE